MNNINPSQNMSGQKKIMKPGNSNTPKPPKKKRRWFVDLLLLVALIALGYMFFQAEQSRREVQGELEQTASQLEELRNNTENSGAQVAQEVLSKVRSHMEVPADPQPTVATITNIEELAQSNEFYNVAENGDHLILTEKRAILYDPDRDIILDVVPVRINQVSPTPDAGQGTTGTNASPTPGGSPNPTEEAASPSPAL